MEIGSKRIALADSRVVFFRQVTPEDDAFLIAVYGSTRAEELALTNWDDSQRETFLRMQFGAQAAHYLEHYPGGEHFIIFADGEAVGRVYVANIEKEIRILDITLFPRNRGTGIGAPIIKELMAEAAGFGKPLTIYIESYNRSMGLFERLGFAKVGEHGYSHLMEWRSDLS